MIDPCLASITVTCLPCSFHDAQYPVLQQLESEGVVEVACAKTYTANWRNASDWTVGTDSPSCVPNTTHSSVSIASDEQELITVATRK
jgi:hypothetical protein